MSVFDECAPIRQGERNATLFSYAIRVIKRLGATNEAYQAFMHRSECCTVPLEGQELTSIWNSAVKHYDSRIAVSEGYLPPEAFSEGLRLRASQTQVEVSARRAERKQVTIEVVAEALHALGITVNDDIITGLMRVKGLPEEYSQAKSGNTLPVVVHDYIKDAGYRTGKGTVEDCIANIADMNRVNPVEDMFLSENWDGEDRYHYVYSALGVEETSIEAIFVRKWLIQTAALAVNDEDEPLGAEGVLVLRGPQGCGKTRFFRWLAMKREWFMEGVSIDTDKKDTVIQSTRCWIAELGELDSTLRRDQPALKAFLTQATDTYRVPYAKLQERRARRTSFAATVNGDTFLNDDTGSRRYWVISVSAIAMEVLEALPDNFRKQLWIQAYLDFKKDPGAFRLTKLEAETLNVNNKKYDIPLPYEVEVRDKLNYGLEESTWKWYTSTAFKAYIPGYPSSTQIGRVLTKLGKEDARIATKKAGNRCYYRLPFTG